MGSWACASEFAISLVKSAEADCAAMKMTVVRIKLITFVMDIYSAIDQLDLYFIFDDINNRLNRFSKKSMMI